MKLTFFNHYGIGDLFESREFVLDWMRLLGVTEAQYAHRKFPGLFADLPQLTSVDVLPEMDMRRAITWRANGVTVPTRAGADELWVNTWVGARNATTTPPGDYVVWPGVGCVVEHIHRMHNDYLREAGLPPLPRTLVEYLPVIDYARLQAAALLRIQGFVNQRRGKRLVLVCNGDTGSGHAANFCMMDMVQHLPVNPDVVYLFTQRAPVPLGGIADRDLVFTDDLTNRQPGECDVNLVSYLARFCEVIVGRCSGAQMPCQTRENWLDSTKTLVCFTEHRNGACFVLHPEALRLNMQVVWSGATTPADAAAVLVKTL